MEGELKPVVGELSYVGRSFIVKHQQRRKRRRLQETSFELWAVSCETDE
jgi:hypothetical protein